MINIRKSFSTKLSVALLILAAPIFVISLGVLFSQSRKMIRNEAIGHASSVLNATMQQLNRHFLTIETATNANLWQVEQVFTPDSLLYFANRIVSLNPHIDGCSISAEPDMFPKYGRYFSAYSVRKADSVTTVIEEPYDYFNKVWYKTPHQLRDACWVAYYDEVDSLELTLDGMLASYCKPLYNADSAFVGVISTDLSLLRLSHEMSAMKPYPHSYFMLIGENGRYYVHPDSTLLFKQTIFTGADTRKQTDQIVLGHEMTSGKRGNMMVNMDGADCIVCYQPVPGTKWSLAIVCPDSDVMEGYHRLIYIVVSLLVLGLLVIILLSHRAMSHTIRPLHELLDKTQSITAGNMDVTIPRTTRIDVIGRLQNSFAQMLESLNYHMKSVRFVSDQTRQRNEELLQATRMAQEADRQKTTFIQNVTHQIRTPLNIIMGFAQVLSDAGSGNLSDDDLKNVTDTMNHNATQLNRMVQMLFDSSDSGLNEEMNCDKTDTLLCVQEAHQAADVVRQRYPGVSISIQSQLADDFSVLTNRTYFMHALLELMYNAAKYSDGKHVELQVSADEAMVSFAVQDQGNGIPEAEVEHLFKFFTKVDDLSEGLGLGLPLAKRHAQNLGGDVVLDTTYHGGCRFILTIPNTN
ncbi:methyl-accepting chemotaxis sensory transducer with Cache sensor [Xylanibacter ruminicola]|uniref:histidine kinase n=1 Tax=Xylanibacter ruminicola TaxID=839 RepID=A0A1M7IEX3_XYLRU|nr:ATP-binding protein [Xylanibacter ruminicola]SFB78765.1 methyl-accepting chemotaxis sensory transducer with Cache sensor [Xylanibacter ruminicola]SHM39301.1 methyl-accepting chemotaxis sensory transducer with Cache sensor [Xylanibacter ruminicola]